MLLCGQSIYIYMLEYIHQNITLACTLLYAGTIMSKYYVSRYNCTVEHTWKCNWYYFNTSYAGLGMYRVGKKIEFPKEYYIWWAGQLSRYSDWLRAGWSGDRIPVEARFSAPVQTGPGAHPASCTMDTGSFLGVKSSRDMTLSPHPLLVSWSWMSRAIPLLSLWAVRPVQSLSDCTRVTFTFFFNLIIYEFGNNKAER